MNEYHIGDRVVTIVDNPSGNPYMTAGMVGTVIYISGGDWPIWVAWDDELKHGHNCDGRCDRKHGWRVYSYEIAYFLPEDDEECPVDSAEIDISELFSS